MPDHRPPRWRGKRRRVSIGLAGRTYSVRAFARSRVRAFSRSRVRAFSFFGGDTHDMTDQRRPGNAASATARTRERANARTRERANAPNARTLQTRERVNVTYHRKPMPARVQSVAERLCRNVERVLVGKRSVIQLAIVAVLREGHVLIEDVPGVGKQ